MNGISFSSPVVLSSTSTVDQNTTGKPLEPCDETNTKAAVDHLYMVFYEGASKGSGQERQWRFSGKVAEMYKNSRVIGDISDLRNFYFHKHAKQKDTEAFNKAFKEAGDIYYRYPKFDTY